MSELQADPEVERSERGILEAALDAQREVLLFKMAGASEADLRKRLVPSHTTLLGLVKHVAYSERWWFQDRFAGHEVTDPFTAENPDADFIIEPDDETEAILDLYRAECAKSRSITADAKLSDVARHSSPATTPRRTLRWILVHMIEETARHNGHADILREQLDGATGDHLVRTVPIS
jgi:uncharacterized damage-inducible protein DinB